MMHINDCNCINFVLLSICLPTYNRCTQITRQIEDVVRQTKKVGACVEILVSDNASTDGTAEMLRCLSAKYTHVKFFVQPQNIGAEANFLFLAQQATGKYYWCIGDDDIIRPGTVEYVVGILKKYNNLGAVILKCGGVRPTLLGKNLRWKNTDFNVYEECLVPYTPQVLCKYPNIPEDTDWMFITKCVILRDAYIRIASDHEFQGNCALSLFATCLSIQNKSFYYANVCGYITGMQDGRLDNWHYKAFEVCQNIIAGIEKLAKFGFTKEELNYLYTSEEAHIYYVNTLGCIAHELSIKETIDSNLALQRQLGIPASEKRYWEKLSKKDPQHVIFLLKEIINIGYHGGDIAAYLKVRKEMIQYGYIPSRLQELKWIIKYMIVIRILSKIKSLCKNS